MKETPRIIGIVGYPLDFTLSPAVHNAAFRRMRLPFVYLPFAIAPRDLPNLLRCMRLTDVEGLNVTMPHKERVGPLLDRLEPEARAIGAVNTIALRRGKYVGYNTDAPAFRRSVRAWTGASLFGRRVTLLGAGGVARAAAYAACQDGAERVAIVNRTFAKAEAVARGLRRAWPRVRIDAVRARPAVMRQLFRATDFLVHATPANGAALTVPLPCAALPHSAILCDLRYAAKPTHLIARARALGLQAFDGLPLFIEQAALSFFLWTGRQIDRTRARRTARNTLKSFNKYSKPDIRME